MNKFIRHWNTKNDHIAQYLREEASFKDRRVTIRRIKARSTYRRKRYLHSLRSVINTMHINIFDSLLLQCSLYIWVLKLRSFWRRRKYEYNVPNWDLHTLSEQLDKSRWMRRDTVYYESFYLLLLLYLWAPSSYLRQRRSTIVSSSHPSAR